MLSYSTIVAALLEAVPIPQSVRDECDEDLPYQTFGAFALQLSLTLRTGGDKPFEVASVRFLDEMAESSNQDIQNLLVVSVLEIIADNDESTDRFRSLCGEEARKLLDRVRDGWHPRLDA